MLEPKWTPGPWNWEFVSALGGTGGHLYLIDSTGRKIGVCWGKAEEKEANARLLAAAPELYAALIVISSYAKAQSPNAFEKIHRLARAALANARGDADA